MSESRADDLKVVFDTQVFLRALINSRSACGRLFSEWRGAYTLYLTAEIEAEIRDVLSRDYIRAKFPQITDDSVTTFLTEIVQIAEYIVVKPEDIEPICRDPKDDVFLACAKLTQADFLVSEDKDLLVLGQHHTAQIVGVAAFLTALETRNQA